MSDHQSSTDDPHANLVPDARFLLQSALEQLSEDSRLYNQAVGSYNTHLDNHRERRDLYDLPFRSPVSAHEAFDGAMAGERDAIEAVLAQLLDETHLDSHLRRHPRTYPIHVEACEHLEIARERLVTTLEDALLHVDVTD